MQLSQIRFAVLPLLLLLATPCLAHGPLPTDWPLARIIGNLEARLAASPQDAKAHYSLGRAHAFAFALHRSSLLVFEQQSGIWVEDLDGQRQRLGENLLDIREPGPAEQLAHLTEGVKHLRLACELVSSLDFPDIWKKRFELTLAWLIETGAHLGSRVDTRALFDLHAVDVSDQEAAQIQQVLRDLWQAPNRLQIRRDLQPPFVAKMARYCSERSVSSDADEQAAIDALLEHYWREEAIEHYRRSAEAAIDRVLSRHMRLDLSEAREAQEAYTRLVRERGFRDDDERNFVEQQEERLKELEKLPLGRLVTPMVLSLDKCGALEELVAEDLAVPFDLDGDAIDELGIVALSAQATMRVGASLANLCGLEMSDGRVLPTYDWVLAPVEGP